MKSGRETVYFTMIVNSIKFDCVASFGLRINLVKVKISFQLGST